MPNIKRGMTGAAGVTTAAGYELWTWGSNAGGALGRHPPSAYGNTAANKSPVQVGDLATWTGIFMGRGIGRAIKSDGTLWSWGRNHAGQVGDSSVIYRSSPVQVGSATDWTDAKMGGAWSTFIVKADGTLWVWGDNNYVGTGGFSETAIDRSTPTQLGSLTNWSKVSQTVGQVLAVKTDGTMWSWGDGRSGGLGLNTAVKVSSPTQIGSLTTWADVAAGVHCGAAIKTDGTLWTWGKSYNGESGRDFAHASAHTSSPQQVGSLTNWSKIDGGSANFVAIKTDGTMWSWGNGNPSGAVGDIAKIDRSSPVQIGSLTTWANVDIGTDFATAIKTDGTLWAWGTNSYGGVGQGDAVVTSSPVQIGSLTTWKYFASGDGTTAALKSAS